MIGRISASSKSAFSDKADVLLRSSNLWFIKKRVKNSNLYTVNGPAVACVSSVAAATAAAVCGPPPPSSQGSPGWLWGGGQAGTFTCLGTLNRQKSRRGGNKYVSIYFSIGDRTRLQSDVVGDVEEEDDGQGVWGGAAAAAAAALHLIEPLEWKKRWDLQSRCFRCTD